MTTTKSRKLASLGRRASLAFTLVLATLAFSASPALAAAEPHPKIGEFGSFTNPNGIAIDEASGSVYVADIATTNAVYKFDANGTPVNFNFPAGSKEAPGNTLKGADTPAESFSFPSLYGTPAAIAVDNACVQHTPALTGKACEAFDPSAGDLYVMDSGHGAIDKFSPEGRYLSQIGGFPPSTGSADGELLGLGVDGSGTVHVNLTVSEENLKVRIEEFDDAAVNHLIARQDFRSIGMSGSYESGINGLSEAHGFAVSATGDDYPIYEPSCSCTAKFGQKLSALGRVDSAEAGDVAVAVDPATGHLYADDQSSVAEWDTGAMNRDTLNESSSVAAPGQAAGTLVARFGSLELSGTSGQGGIAVDGASGDVYVSNPANGKVYVFASDAPAVTVREPADVTREGASLSGTVDPRGVAVSECEFEYGLTDEFGHGPYDHSVPCKQTPGEIGAGSSPVAVSAQLEGLEPGELYHFRLIATNANGAGQAGGMLATHGVGFGIKGYEISFLNENGTPDTQAGSHPYQFVNTFTLNSHFKREESNADSPYIRLPNGVLRNVKLDLPPGFVGDPNATPQKCTGEELSDAKCRPETRVGRLYLSWSEAQTRISFFSDWLYNMVPPRGVALQLGSNFILPLLYINSGVLAGGNYPVQTTVTEAPAQAPVIKSTAVISGVVGEGVNRKPFLTMPTGCHGPLSSTMEAERGKNRAIGRRRARSRTTPPVRPSHSRAARSSSSRRKSA